MKLFKKSKVQSEELNQVISQTDFDAAAITEPVHEQIVKKPGFFRRHWLKFVSVTLIVVLSAFGAFQTYQSYKYYGIAGDNKLLYEEQVSLNEQISNELSKTEEGRKSLEILSNTLKDQNTALEERAETAEEQYNQAQKNLNAKLAELQQVNTKLASLNAEMEKINADLNTKKAKIEQLNRGIAKFAEVEVLISDFEASNLEYIYNVDKSIEQINNYMATLHSKYIDNANAYLQQGQRQFTIMDRLSKEIREIFDDIKAGNY